MSEIEEAKRGSKFVLRLAAFCLAAAAIYPVMNWVKTQGHATSQELEDKYKSGVEGYEEIFARAIRQMKAGDYQPALDTLHSVDPHSLVKDLQAEWYITKSQIFQIRAESYRNEALREKFALKAIYMSKRALEVGVSDETMINLELNQAHLFTYSQQWEKAFDIFKKVEEATFVPEKRWEYRMRMVDCLVQLGRRREAVSILESIAEESDDEMVWAKAVRNQGDFLLELAKEDKGELKIDVEEKVRALYKEVIKETPPLNRERKKAEVSLLRLYAKNNELGSTYDLANHIKKVSNAEHFSAEVLLILSDLEVRRNNVPQAIKYLKSCLEEYPDLKSGQSALIRYYSLLKKIDAWEAAFDAGESLIRTVRDDPGDWIPVCLDLMVRKDSFYEHLNFNNLSKKYFKRALEMMTRCSEVNRPDVQECANFAIASLYYQQGDHYNADVQLSKYIKEPDYIRFREQAHYLYLKNAKNGAKPETVVALRARLYLNNTFDSVNSNEVLLALSQAYFSLEMFDEALMEAKRIYLKFAETASKDLEGPKARQLIETISIMGMCYDRLGQSDKTDKLFNIWIDQFVNTSDVGNVFLTWARLAAEKKQYYEAVRRLNLILPYLKEHQDNLRIESWKTIYRLALKDSSKITPSLSQMRKVAYDKFISKADKQVLFTELSKAHLRQYMDDPPIMLLKELKSIDKIRNGLLIDKSIIIKWLSKSMEVVDPSVVKDVFQKYLIGSGHAKYESEELISNLKELEKQLENHDRLEKDSLDI